MPGLAQAQTFPNRFITLMVPFSAGGSTDILARLVADAMSKDLGQPVVVENAPGAGGAIAAKRLIAAPADGYTLLIGNTGTLAAGIGFYRQKSFDPPVDFAAIASVADAPQIIVARKDIPVSNLDEFAAYVKANEDKLNFGAAGIGSGSYLGAVLVNAALGLKLQPVNYRSSGATMNDLLAGNVAFSVESTTGSLPQIQSGGVRAVAVLQEKRIAAAPDIPAAAESRFKDVNYRIWNVIVARKGTPDAVLSRLGDSIRKAMADETFKTRTAQLGLERPEEARTMPAGAQALLAEEAKRWLPLVAGLGVTIE